MVYLIRRKRTENAAGRILLQYSFLVIEKVDKRVKIFLIGQFKTGQIY